MGSLPALWACMGRVQQLLILWWFTPSLCFTIATISVIGGKVSHIYAHLAALQTIDVAIWGFTFFLQDTIILLLFRLFLSIVHNREIAQKAESRQILGFRVAGLVFGFLLSFSFFIVATVNISFFLVARTEFHWRNVGFVGDKSSRKVLLSGLFASIVTALSILGASFALRHFCYSLAGAALKTIGSALLFVLGKIPRIGQQLRTKLSEKATPRYAEVSGRDVDSTELALMEDDGSDSDDGEYFESRNLNKKHGQVTGSGYGEMTYWVIGVVLAVQVVLSCLRPHQNSFTFMSWTLPLLPLIDFQSLSPSLAGLIPMYGPSIQREWDNRSALSQPLEFPWLPEEPVAGFEDWYEPGKRHYNAAKDPLKVSNIEDPLLEELRGHLKDIDVRHIVLIKLESTRQDVFPFKKDGFIWKKFAHSFDDNTIPPRAQERLASLTPIANLLTGDFDDGFEHESTQPRGGLNFDNAYTAATYTRKSMTGTLCGMAPLVADFNIEYQNHMYQPCLPQVLEALSQISGNSSASSGSDSESRADGKEDFTSYRWRSWMMHSTTDTYDKEENQIPFLGYDWENFIYKEYLKSNDSKFGPSTLPEINYFGTAEIALEDYIRDAFVRAKDEKERVFLTHLTSTTHDPFAIPDQEDNYVRMGQGKALSRLSHYANAVGYVDGWLGKILNILDEEGVANETLIVAVGDHGLSVAEDNANTAYHNPNVGNFHVPLIVSHPQMPYVSSSHPVTSISVLPTILDILRETGSLTKEASQAAFDLAGNYEGQSLIRPLRNESDTGHSEWQFSLMNPGRSKLAVRSALAPGYRLVVPLVENIEWRFSDVVDDPHEMHPVESFGFHEFLKKVAKQRGEEQARWSEEAAFMTRWWVEDNRKRYRYKAELIQNN